MQLGIAPAARRAPQGRPVGQFAAAAISESERSLYRTKSYTGHAVGVLVLYFLLWIPGLIANIIFLKEGRRSEQLAGQNLPGVGCLSAMLWFWIVIAVVAVLVIVVVASSV